MNAKVKKIASATAKVAVPIATAVVLSRLTTGKLDLKGALLDAAEAAVRAAKAKRSVTVRVDADGFVTGIVGRIAQLGDRPATRDGAAR